MVTRVLNPASSLLIAPREGFRPRFTAPGTLPYQTTGSEDPMESYASADGLVPTILGATSLDW